MSKLLWLYLVVATVGAPAQGTAADYRRTEIADTAYVDKVYNKAITWNWLDNENRFWYSQLTPTGKEFILVDVKKKTKARAFDHEKLAKALSAKSNKPVNPNKLPFREIDFKEKGAAIEFMVDYAGKNFRYDIQMTDGSGGGEIVWMSERNGWNHLYLYDWKGNVKNQITKGEWVVREIVFVDQGRRQITFQASGMDAGIDPYFHGTFRINFEGTGLMRLTTPGTDHTVQFSPDKSLFYDISQRSDLPPVLYYKRCEGW